MNVKLKDRIGDLEIVDVDFAHLDAKTEMALLSPELGISQGKGGALYDLSKIKTADHSGLCALVNLYTSPYPVGFFRAGKEFSTLLKEKGLESLLDIRPTLEKALKLDWTRKFQLAGRKVVILSAGYGTRCRPLTLQSPKSMLPVLGRPILHHIINHLKQFGVRDIFLNPGYLGTEIHDYFQSGKKLGAHINYANEGRYKGGKWVENILGSASSLANMQDKINAFDDDFFVLCGDGLSDINLIAMLEHHKKTGAIASVATKTINPEESEKYGLVAHDAQSRITRFQEKPPPSEAVSNLANIGIYIFSPRIFDYVSCAPGSDIGHHLLPRLIAKGEYVANYQTDASWLDVGCGRDFFQANCAFLEQAKDAPEDFGIKWRKNIALGAGAQFMRGASAKGAVYIGEGSIVHAQARLVGPCFIGAGSVIEGKSFIENSIIMPGTHVMHGAYAVDAVACGHWAFSHPFATHGVELIEPLEQIRPLNEAIALRYQQPSALQDTGS